ncbi:hypothetical protein HLB76_004324 [Salmonella enterica]|uniref:Uncharacterized protein n=2 Tax=Salmonella enterica TaxID=28901 RepID=A0A756DCM4_SALER|nr:hypothetical protein [Salmonella enterica subsp. enterica serovar Infantis]EDT1667924.1 hypothetical protein [Salmonella enterica subsp. enterica]EEB6960430.1 hypothetical protein [Salmonella enterica subsp. enterica serovar Anatum]EEF8108256.1 hypothetical protein [Salmonella enterica]EKJ4933635.1 hypothetical protein [Salmonella enterica subsp. enterica serovar Litchfield]
MNKEEKLIMYLEELMKRYEKQKKVNESLKRENLELNSIIKKLEGKLYGQV